MGDKISPGGTNSEPSLSKATGVHTQRKGGFANISTKYFPVDASRPVCPIPFVKKTCLENCPRGVIFRVFYAVSMGCDSSQNISVLVAQNP